MLSNHNRIIRHACAVVATAMTWAGHACVGARAGQPPAVSSAPSTDVTMSSLLRQMSDLSRLAEWPDPPFTTRQFSSFDRASKSPGENWFANADCGQFLWTEDRGDRAEFVMMEAQGPGAIVRIWSANPMGTLRVYLDHAAEPQLEAPLADYLGGKMRSVIPPIACETSRGFNCYLPIPYARHCKVTCDRGAPRGGRNEHMYYHVNYRSYPAGTNVRTFASGDAEKAAAQIAAVARALTPDTGVGAARPSIRPPGAAAVPPGKHAELSLRTESGGVVDDLSIRLWANDATLALRQCILSICFDGRTTVDCPVGDFFGAAPGENPYDSLPMRVSRDGWMQSRWSMPYEKSATMTLRNRGQQQASVEWNWHAADRPWTARSMHFGAKWRSQRDVPTRPMIDWNYMRATGQGTFVGTAFTIANPVKAWWGEGDEKIYCDGETFPGTFGTGTEDYFGYAWCWPERFTHAYHNQTRCDGPGNYGYTSVNRWHVLDCIPFARDFRFDMELWHWAEACKVSMSNVCYWYARPGATDNYAAISDADLVALAMPPYVPPRVAGAIEGERMRIIAKTGTPGIQDIDGCSGEKHLWWHGGQQPGDTLALGFDVADAGRYQVFGRFLTARDYGIMRLSINGREAGEPVDFYSPTVVAAPERQLGEFELKKGENAIHITVVGANDKAIKEYMFGLDYLRIVAAK